MNIDLMDAQQALGFVRSQTEYIETQVNEVQYPDIQYPNLIPVDTSAPEWIRTVSFVSTDKVGKAQWFNAASQDVPVADLNRTKKENLIRMAAIGYEWNLEEVNQARMLGINLGADKASAARRAYEEFVDGVAMTGDSEVNLEGLVNNSAVSATSVAQNGGSTSTNWVDKTTAEILKDINDAISGVIIDSNQVEMADTLLLPLEQHALLASTPRSDTSDTTLLSYVKRENFYTAQTGRELMIRSVRALDGAGAGATDRMIAYRRDPQVLKLHIPMPHRFFPAQQDILRFVVPGIFRLGGVEIRRPKAVRFLDGI